MENQFNEILTATVSHEMRTPLNSMITLLFSIRKFITDPKGLELLSII
jgi:signal transduction histidine kinase